MKIIIMLFLTAINFAQTSYIALPLASVDGQNYRAELQIKDGGDLTYSQPIFTYEDKAVTYSAVTDAFQTYTFDFEGEKVNDYLSFDGVNDYVTVADDNSLDFGTGDFSIEWYGSIDLAEPFFMLSNYASSDENWSLQYNKTKIASYFVAGGSIVIQAENVNYILTQDEYYHFVWVVDRSDSNTMYVNGELVTLTINTVDNGVNNFNGATTQLNSYDVSYHNKGNTKIARIWKGKLLSANDVATLYANRNSTSATTVTDSLVLDLNGIDGNISATTWTDASGKGNDGTISGATWWKPPYLKVSASDITKFSLDNVSITPYDLENTLQVNEGLNKSLSPLEIGNSSKPEDSYIKLYSADGTAYYLRVNNSGVVTITTE